MIGQGFAIIVLLSKYWYMQLLCFYQIINDDNFMLKYYFSVQQISLAS